MEIGGAAMQRMAAAGGPGPLSLQGPPRSVKISPVNIQDEPGDLTSQSTYTIKRIFTICSAYAIHSCDLFTIGRKMKQL